MSPLTDVLLRGIGLAPERVHVFDFGTQQAQGAASRWEEDLQSTDNGSVTAGRLVELHSVLDHRHVVSDPPVVRFDIWEQDFLLATGQDDPVVSLVGPGATAPGGFPSEQRALNVVTLTNQSRAREAVEAHKAAHPNDFENTILVLRDQPATGNHETHVIAWWRAQAGSEPVSEPELYFELNADTATGSVVDAPLTLLHVADAVPGVAVRLSGRFLDSAPFGAATEPLPGVAVRAARRIALSTTDGGFALDARLPVGETALTLGRDGVDPLAWTLRATVNADGTVRVAVRDAQGAERAAATTASVPDATTLLVLPPLGDVSLRVHKLRGTVVWPDSQPDAAHPGLPLAGRRVFVLPLPDGKTRPRRPRTSRGWDELKQAPGVLRSNVPGKAGQDLPTEAGGAFEVRFVDLRVGRRYLVWVESADPDAAAATTTSPEMVVRTLHRDLLHLTDVNADDRESVGHHLVDHTYNLTSPDAVAWKGDALRIVDWQVDPASPDPNRRDARLIRPDPRAKDDFDKDWVGGQMAVERIQYDPAQRLAHGLRLQALPMVPVDEPPDFQSAAARAVTRAFGQAFPDGHFRDEVRFVLDPRRIPSVALAPPAVWDTAWDPTAGLPLWQQHRAAELVGKTFAVSPLIRRRQVLPAGRQAPVSPVDAADARWSCDALPLADHARIEVPRVRDNVSNANQLQDLTQQLIGNRRLTAWPVPVLAPVPLRFTALTAQRHISFAPGHGWYARPASATAAAQWVSERPVGWLFGAGEDETSPIASRVALRSFARHDLVTTMCRELADLSAAGVVQPAAANGAFEVTTDRDFLRLWQQNPIYYLGHRRTRVRPRGGGAERGAVSGTYLQALLTAGGQPRDRRTDAPLARIRYAALLADAAGRPIDLYLAVHTNALDPVPPTPDGTNPDPEVRGVMALYLDVADDAGNEGNDPGIRFAGHLVDAVVARCGLRRKDRARAVPGTRSMRQNGGSVLELRNTFPHWEEQSQPPLSLWQRARRVNRPQQGNWEQPEWQENQGAFPRAIPVALLEAGFHNNPSEAPIIAAGWFRRLIGEAMVEGSERQLRQDQTGMTRRDVQRMLRATFGRTSPKATDDTLIGGDLATYVQDATGAPPAVLAGADLQATTAAIDSARAALTRQMLVDVLRTALATACGYAAGDAELANLLGAVVLGGAALSRPGEPVTRDEAAGLIAAAIGLRPGLLNTVTTTPLGPSGTTLLANGPAPHTFLTKREVDPSAPAPDSLRSRLAALRPREIYRAPRLYLADTRLRPLGDPFASAVYRLTEDTPVVIVAEAAGLPWRATAANVRFTVSYDDFAGGRATVEGGGREPARLWSRAWPITDLGSEEHRLLEVAVQHPTDGWQTIGSQRIWLKAD